MLYFIMAVMIVVSYFIGNISPATLAGRMHGVDIRKEGSGNPGTTNVLRTLGVRAAAFTLLTDILKGVLPVLAGRAAGGELLACACGTAAFIGHIWPVCFGFKGGKGIATGFGVIVAFRWPAGLICFAAALAGAAASRRMSVGSITAAVAFPVAFYFLKPDYLLWSVCLALIVIWRHKTNIRRLVNGEEPAMSFSHKKDDEEHKMSQYKQKTAVIGSGSWGTAVATALSVNGHDVRLWGRNAEQMSEMQRSRENRKYLPGVVLPDNIACTSDARAAIDGADMTIYVVPAQSFRSTFEATEGYLPENALIVNCAKGIETGTLKRISEIAAEIRPDVRFAVLSGPSHAEEVGRRLPTTLVAASADQVTAQKVQDAFMSEFLRVYTNDDVIGVEIGGALKNIIALAAGISDGMGYGDNAKAALMTRAMSEISRLGVRLGAERSTFMGLTGIGDLIVTCTSMHSRNRRCGIMIGEGMAPDEATEKVGMVVEGMYTTEAAYEMAEKYRVEMPITEQLYHVIKGTVSGPDAVRNLMLRSRKHEDE